MCGAGGGGCFIITHQAKDKSEIEKAIAKTPMRVLDFKSIRLKNNEKLHCWYVSWWRTQRELFFRTLGVF
jgi:galactokinase/mevalonate kinase-like predicted kinase